MKAIIAFIVFCCVATIGLAQTAPESAPDEFDRPELAGKSAEELATKRSERLTQILGLSADQQSKVYTAALSQAQKVKAIKASADNETKKKSDRLAAATEFDQFMYTILDETQKAKYEEMKKKRAERMTNGNGPGKGKGKGRGKGN